MKISASAVTKALREVINDLVGHQIEVLHIDCNDNLNVFSDIKK